LPDRSHESSRTAAVPRVRLAICQPAVIDRAGRGVESLGLHHLQGHEQLSGYAGTAWRFGPSRVERSRSVDAKQPIEATVEEAVEPGSQRSHSAPVPRRFRPASDTPPPIRGTPRLQWEQTSGGLPRHREGRRSPQHIGQAPPKELTSLRRSPMMAPRYSRESGEEGNPDYIAGAQQYPMMALISAEELCSIGVSASGDICRKGVPRVPALAVAGRRRSWTVSQRCPCAFSTCQRTEEYRRLVTATPTFVLNGATFSLGNPSSAELAQALTDLLAQAEGHESKV
jgi:hypothetical protein